MINTKKKTFLFCLMFLFLFPLKRAYSTQKWEEEAEVTAYNHAISLKSLRENLLESGVIVKVWSGALQGAVSWPCFS
jgi:hypothetical protein